MKLKGSYTVEAALVFPFIMSVIVLVCYLSFFIHDRAVMDAASYQAALRGSLVTAEKSDFVGKAEKAGDELLKNALLVTRVSEKSVELDNNTIIVKYSGDFLIPYGVNFIPGIPHSIPVSVESRAKHIDPTGFVRSCRIVENLGKGA
ncbi:MAG: pilus assembly protein [Lachnospiraceae bacterium]|nr:pilus assembly protein [Lachnospiraceae bacterium]